MIDKLITDLSCAIGYLAVALLAIGIAILATGTYKIIDDGGLRIRTERTTRVREILELFGVEDPEQLPLSVQT